MINPGPLPPKYSSGLQQRKSEDEIEVPSIEENKPASLAVRGEKRNIKRQRLENKRNELLKIRK